MSKLSTNDSKVAQKRHKCPKCGVAEALDIFLSIQQLILPVYDDLRDIRYPSFGVTFGRRFINDFI